MRLEFVKMNGLGNDFVFIDDLSEEIELDTVQVKRLCDRHFGIGADGVILVRPPKDGGLAFMYYINSDGTLAQMCGNGVRCFAKYLVDRGFADATEGKLVAETLAGLKPIEFRTDDDGRMTDATVDMGCPILEPSSVPVALAANATAPDGSPCVEEFPVSSPWGDFRFTAVSMGNPHAVCFIDDWNQLPDSAFTDPENKSLDSFDIDTVGAFFESNSIFPEKANIEFAEVTPSGLSMRVYERGCGETLACGTGTCATAVAGALTERSGRDVDVRLLGGILYIEWADNGHVYMTGAAEESFTGTVDL